MVKVDCRGAAETLVTVDLVKSNLVMVKTLVVVDTKEYSEIPEDETDLGDDVPSVHTDHGTFHGQGEFH